MNYKKKDCLTKKKILVLGCNGMAGFTISKYLKDSGYDVIGLARTESLIVETIIQDVEHLPSLDKVIKEGQYNVCLLYTSPSPRD